MGIQAGGSSSSIARIRLTTQKMTPYVDLQRYLPDALRVNVILTIPFQPRNCGSTGITLYNGHFYLGFNSVTGITLYNGHFYLGFNSVIPRVRYIE
jgi:hypothetical protein